MIDLHFMTGLGRSGLSFHNHS